MKKFKDRVPIPQLVFDSWVSNGNGYMTVSDIAEQSFGEGYNAYSYRDLESKVKRAIPKAIALAAEHGFVVIGKKNFKLKGNPYDRWKIAGEFDQKDLIEVLKERTNRVKGYIDSRNLTIKNASDNKLLPPDKLNELN